MAAVTAGNAGVVEGEAGAAALFLQREGDQRIDAGRPVLRAPGLHDAFAGNEFDVAPADPAAVAGKLVTRLAADPGRAIGGHCRMLARTHQDLVDTLRACVELINLMDRCGHDDPLQNPVAKRAMTTMMATCMLPCIATTRT